MIVMKLCYSEARASMCKVLAICNFSLVSISHVAQCTSTALVICNFVHFTQFFFFFEHFHSHINVRWVWILTVVSQFFGIRICNDLLKSTDFASRWLERTHFRIGWWLNAFLQWNCHCQNGMAFIILFINEKLTLY